MSQKHQKEGGKIMRETEPQCVLIRNKATGEYLRYLRGPNPPQGYEKVRDIAVPGMKMRQPVYDRKGNVLPEFSKYPMWKKK
jgi:hypothetical protein